MDFYSSARDALRLFEGRAGGFVTVYVDDLALSTHTRYAGKLLAIREFNDEHELRKFEFKLQVLDHPERNDLSRPSEIAEFENPYLQD